MIGVPALSVTVTVSDAPVVLFITTASRHVVAENTTVAEVGTAASAFALNPSRASYTSDEEFDVVAYVRFKNPNPFYDFDVVGEPDDVGTTLDEILIVLPFESAIAGDPFFCEVTQSDTVAQDGFSLHYDIHVKCTPSEYWSWDGRIDTSTGEPI